MFNQHDLSSLTFISLTQNIDLVHFEIEENFLCECGESIWKGQPYDWSLCSIWKVRNSGRGKGYFWENNSNSDRAPSVTSVMVFLVFGQQRSRTVYTTFVRSIGKVITQWKPVALCTFWCFYRHKSKNKRKTYLWLFLLSLLIISSGIFQKFWKLYLNTIFFESKMPFEQK